MHLSSLLWPLLQCTGKAFKCQMDCEQIQSVALNELQWIVKILQSTLNQNTLYLLNKSFHDALTNLDSHTLLLEHIQERQELLLRSQPQKHQHIQVFVLKRVQAPHYLAFGVHATMWYSMVIQFYLKLAKKIKGLGGVAGLKITGEKSYKHAQS